MAVGPDGALWCAEIGAGGIARVASGGEVTEFALPDPACRPHAVTVGPDGACWFTAWATGRIGRITEEGQVTEYALPPAPGPSPTAWRSAPTVPCIRPWNTAGSPGSRSREASRDGP
ncbi:hydrolase [Streptomyces mobaraensis NBRC 13819 = DSM 40847]|uniref:Hydrolase n=1 Tax=Streptomyces mobaraensis (strain ATCC 29032 / DSM 40847 / JCM 4168 / NBRC 13819 / NCIMB 11159 / IPCR 16-22) TaxID=1223523 RepID=M3C0V6_STRM1|nr:hydrolase [Streptomyces mobaraensis NBRC 13819 = DSM 40847]